LDEGGVRIRYQTGRRKQVDTLAVGEKLAGKTRKNLIDWVLVKELLPLTSMKIDMWRVVIR